MPAFSKAAVARSNRSRTFSTARTIRSREMLAASGFTMTAFYQTLAAMSLAALPAPIRHYESDRHRNSGSASGLPGLLRQRLDRDTQSRPSGGRGSGVRRAHRQLPAGHSIHELERSLSLSAI